MQTATPASQAERALCARFQRSIPERVNADPHLVWRGRTLSVDCLVQIGSTAFLLHIDRGSIRECPHRAAVAVLMGLCLARHAAGVDGAVAGPTAAGMARSVRAVCAALELDRPVLMGCSIGGRIALQLAHAHGEEFRALIALESADYQQPWYDTEWLHRGDLQGGEVCAALVSGLIAPQSPDQHRHETLWQYMQSGPGVFKGDLYFYRVDADLRGKLCGIDTARCPLYLLTGEYDFSCAPEDTMRTAAGIPGAKVAIMQGVGHFPMSENPAQFRRYILPVLDEIRRGGR